MIWAPQETWGPGTARRCAGAAAWQASGFTLVEAMIAVMIAALVLAAAIELGAMAVRVRAAMERRVVAVQLLNNRLESVRDFSFGQLAQAAELDTRVDRDGVPRAAGLYRRTTRVVPGDDWNGDGQCDDYLVRVTVTYPRALRRREDVTVTASTYLMNRDTLTPLWSKP